MFDLNFFSVSLWGGFFGLVFCLNISSKLLMVFNLAAPIYSNGSIGDGLYMSSVIYSAALVADSLLDIPGKLLCSGGN